jgi:beta-galactosidase
MTQAESLFKRSFYLAVLFCLAGSSVNGQAEVRQIVSLNRGWTFQLGDLTPERAAEHDTCFTLVNIPHTWNDRDIQSGEQVRYGTAWYTRELVPGDSPVGSQYFLKFEGVGQHAEVYVNNNYVGSHLGSYSAFTFNITRFLDMDTVNSIAVRVNNELAASYPKDNFLFGLYGGIYRDVSLIITGAIHIGLTDHASSGVYIHPGPISREKARLKVVTLLKNDGDTMQQLTLKNTLMGDADTAVAARDTTVDLFPGGLYPVTTWLDVDHPRFWNGKKDPYLYTLESKVLLNGTVVDRTRQLTGIRYFDIDPDSGFILNGAPYRLYGVCRHQEWQDRGNALLPHHHRRDMELIDELGATSIRLAHYQQAESMYALADSMGLLVWAEVPFVNGYLEDADGNARQQLTELIKQNFNHPSIFVWGLHNEVIKGEITQPPVNLTRELHNLAKSLDPHRPTVAVSNIWWVYDHPIHELTDLQGFNQYTGWYGGKPEGLGDWISNYHAAKPDIRFSVSEYGAGGNIAHQSNVTDTVPDPTGQFFPEGYQTHYHETTWSAIEKHPFIWASYVWNMFDFSVPEWDRGGIRGRNHKGLVTYDRKTRKDAFYWYKANWSEEPVLHLTGRRNSQQSMGNLEIKAYCNRGTPELFVDGISLGKMKAGAHSVTYTKQISLSRGMHSVEVRAGHNGHTLTDEYVVTVQ